LPKPRFTRYEINLVAVSATYLTLAEIVRCKLSSQNKRTFQVSTL